MERCESVLTLGQRRDSVLHVRCVLGPAHDGLCRSVLRNVAEAKASALESKAETPVALVSVMLTWQAA